MTYVVTETCVDCKFTSCVSVCPVDSFHELPDRLYINPETCIDCNACMDECPVEAIYPDMDVPDEMQDWIELNWRVYFYCFRKISKTGNILMHQAFPRLSKTPGKVRHSAPLLGGDTDNVLKEIGISAKQIQMLRKNKIIN